jgi:hypothetical protein
MENDETHTGTEVPVHVARGERAKSFGDHMTCGAAAIASSDEA